MPSPTAPSRLRVALRIVGVFFAILIIVVAIGAWRGVLPNFEKRVAAIQAAGQPGAASDLPLSTPLSAEHQAQLKALIQAMDRLSNAVPSMRRLKAGNPVFLETAALRKEVLSLLQADPVVSQLLQPDPSLEPFEGYQDSMNRMILLKQVEVFLRFASLDALKRGQVDDALGCLTNAIRLRLLPEPFVQSPDFWSLDVAPFNRLLVEMVDSRKLHARHLDQLHQAYKTFESAPLFRNHLLGERHWHISNTRELAGTSLSDFSDTPRSDGRLNSFTDWLWLRARLHLGFLDTAGCAVLDEIGAQLADLDRIGEPALLRESRQRQSRIRSRFPRIQNLCDIPQNFLETGALLPKTHARLGLLAIAVARYRLDHAGEFPSSPSDLVPRYLSALPVDPYSGGPPEFGPNHPGVAIGFDRSRLTGPDAIPPTTPGGSSARIRLEK